MKQTYSNNKYKNCRRKFIKGVMFLGFLLLTATGFAQTSFLKEATEKLRMALLKKDTVILKQLLHKNTSYGHSSGWCKQNRM